MEDAFATVAPVEGDAKEEVVAPTSSSDPILSTEESKTQSKATTIADEKSETLSEQAEQMPVYSPMTIYMEGVAISYQNGGQGSGQSIIDSSDVAST